MNPLDPRAAAIVLLLAAGVFAGAQLGKIAPLVGWYREGLGFGLVYIGWLTSTIGLFVALAALPTSLVIDRLGQFRVFLGGSIVLALGGLVLAAARDPALILFGRAIEGAGYLVLVIVIPAILNAVPPPRLKGPVLAIWGGFVPVGFALADFSAAAFVPLLGETGFLFAISLGFAACATAAILLLTRVDEPALAPVASDAPPGIAASASAPVLLVAVSFGFYVVLSIAFFAFLPAAAGREGAALLVSPGLIALLVPLGNAVASLGMRGRGLRAAAIMTVAGFAASLASALPAFLATDPAMVTLAAAVFAIAGGVTASALFGAVPFIVPRDGSASVVIGIICQAGGLTTLLGPPIAAAVIEAGGWSGFAWFLAATSLAGLLAIAPLLRGRQVG